MLTSTPSGLCRPDTYILKTCAHIFILKQNGLTQLQNWLVSGGLIALLFLSSTISYAQSPFSITATSPVCSTNGTGTSVKGYVTLSNYASNSTYQYVEGDDFDAGTKIPTTPASLSGSSQVIINDLDDSMLPRTYTVRVFDANNPAIYTEQQVTVDPSGCCVKPDAGSDMAICSPRTMVNITAAGNGQTWSVHPGNPTSTTITQQGHITGMTENGTYRFILSTGTGCTDTLQIVRIKPISLTVTPGQCSSATNQYSVSGVVSLSNAQAGTLTITDGIVSTTISVVNSTTVLNFTLSGLNSGTGSHMLFAILSSCGMASVTYTAPETCTRPVLTLDKLVDKSRAKLGDTLTYTLILSNQGTAPATNVTVRDSSTAGLRYVANSVTVPAATTFNQGAPVSTWQVPTLSVGASLSLTFQAIADSAGILYNTAMIPGDTVTACTSIPLKVCAGESYTVTLTVAPGRATYTWFKDGVEISGQTTNSLEVTAPGAYSLRTDNTVGACPDFSCCSFVLEEDTLPTFQAVAIPVTCQGAMAQVNGKLILSGFNPAHTYQYSEGTSFDAAHALSGSAQVIPSDGILVSNLPNPVATQSYTIRVYNSSGCYKDVTVTLNPTVCECPTTICVPLVIRQTRGHAR